MRMFQRCACSKGFRKDGNDWNAAASKWDRERSERNEVNEIESGLDRNRGDLRSEEFRHIRNADRFV